MRPAELVVEVPAADNGMPGLRLLDFEPVCCLLNVRVSHRGDETMTRLGVFLLALVFGVLGSVQQTWAQAPVKKFVTKDGKRPTGLFAPGVMVGKTLYIAGKGDYKPQEDTAGKVKNCLGEIRKVLKDAGMDMNNVVQSYIYLEDHD